MNTRPTSARVKESVFNIINEKIYDSNVLDLFSGTGNLGIEALSRGAKLAIFVEQNKECCKIIHENIAKTRLTDNAKILNICVIKWLKSYSCDEKFDLVFIDPPYAKELFIETLNILDKINILSDNGCIIVERSAISNLPENLINLKLYREKNMV